jgi:molybdopterin converting factor small subunit
MNTNSQARHIHVTVKVFGGLRELFEDPAIPVGVPEPASIARLLEKLRAQTPAGEQRLREGIDAGYLNVLVNGRTLPRPNSSLASVSLQDGDVVAFLPPVGGG